MSKKDAAIYRKAAELVFIGDVQCSCDAVSHVAKGERIIDGIRRCFGISAQSGAYANIFQPSNGGFMWGSWWGDFEEQKECRVLALCFAAAMAETGDL